MSTPKRKLLIVVPMIAAVIPLAACGPRYSHRNPYPKPSLVHPSISKTVPLPPISTTFGPAMQHNILSLSDLGAHL